MMNDGITRDEIHDIAKKAACEAVRETFKYFGVDIKDQGSVNKFRADLVSAHQVRLLKETASQRFWILLISAVVIGAFAMFWGGIKDKLGL